MADRSIHQVNSESGYWLGKPRLQKLAAPLTMNDSLLPIKDFCILNFQRIPAYLTVQVTSIDLRLEVIRCPQGSASLHRQAYAKRSCATLGILCLCAHRVEPALMLLVFKWMLDVSRLMFWLAGQAVVVLRSQHDHRSLDQF